MKSLLLALALFLACEAKFECPNMKLLTNNSPDRPWFKVTTSDNASQPKIRKLLFKYGFGKGEPPFRADSNTNLKITVAAKDGSLFSVRRLKIKTTNSDSIKFVGIFEDDTEEPMSFEKEKEPKQFRDSEDWEITSVRTKKVLKAIVIEVQLHDDIDPEENKSSRIFLRGLKVKACVA